MNVLCFDIGGTNIKSMLIGPDEKIDFPIIESKAKDGIEFLKEDIFNCIRDVRKNYEVYGIAISTAGMVDPVSYKIVHANSNFKDYIGFDWKEAINNEFNLPVVVENDVKSAALGEYSFGRAKGYKSVFVLTLGTGIGGALVVDGEIYRGFSGHAGEIGYMRVDGNEFEKIASASALVNRAKNEYPNKDYTNGIKIFDAIDKNEREAISLLDYMTDKLSVGVANIILIANPSMILIGGGISEQKEKLIDPIKEKVKKIIPENLYEKTEITNTSLGNKAGIFGVYSIFRKTYEAR